MNGQEQVRANVSCETFEKLDRFAERVRKWSQKVNLISPASVSDIWTRHIWDSFQITTCATMRGHWVDVGSGGGFPGLVVAIVASETAPNLRITLCESQQRKADFLRIVAQELAPNVVICADRVENQAPFEADILSVRALAGLSSLLFIVNRHLAPSGTALLMKGGKWQQEVAAARRLWHFDCEPIPSQTDSSAAILRVQGVRRDRIHD
ncbi:MAG: 16S rRNA (guanine(527)-N(7))-methyltransferase RsmG [Aestuariivita sp.]|nr:16S rRNA (guanine(527)-N(7))-methyltransferase RsmG [Aestuariivita sp.]MCY4202565.1 16S rRNA (guanine(527)-N(7))-methyltransferase RsmG [Aestuariivita sp.]MCY4289259.1 16S rRNA (guanine(527)-N(7))-methyltransferase RsmG [Aestuariivita sp.]MCY4347372.1 16S rRNA (guanine(527)-N(7))-methyltransferase RsmG [Aestuariivita sp.]